MDAVDDIKALAALVPLWPDGRTATRQATRMFVLQKEIVACLARKCRGKEESPLGKYRIMEESSYIRKGLDLIVLG